MHNHVNYINSNRTNLDFNVIQYGYRRCQPGFHEPKFARQTYLLHYVYSGKGVFTGDNVSYNVQAGQAFLITPDVVAVYVADRFDPFEYRWVEFYGVKVDALLKDCGLSAKNPIYNDGSGALGAALTELVSLGNTDEYALTGAFWNLAATMGGRVRRAEIPLETYFKKAVAYIQVHISDGINVSDIARHLSISRGYLTLVFNSICGKSTKQYIIDYKIDVARRLLQTSNMSIEEIGESIGVVSPSHFSRLFKAETGETPLEFRRKFINHPQKSC